MLIIVGWNLIKIYVIFTIPGLGLIKGLDYLRWLMAFYKGKL